MSHRFSPSSLVHGVHQVCGNKSDRWAEGDYQIKLVCHMHTEWNLSSHKVLPVSTFKGPTIMQNSHSYNNVSLARQQTLQKCKKSILHFFCSLQFSEHVRWSKQLWKTTLCDVTVGSRTSGVWSKIWALSVPAKCIVFLFCFLNMVVNSTALPVAQYHWHYQSAHKNMSTGSMFGPTVYIILVKHLQSWDGSEEELCKTSAEPQTATQKGTLN